MSVRRVPGTSPNTACASTYNAMRSNSGFNHHITSAASQIASIDQASRLTSTSTGNVRISQGAQIATA